MSPGTQPVRKSAEEYVQSGLSVIPIRADGSKSPLPIAWKKFQERRPSPYDVHQLFRGEVGIAILGGKVSGNLEIIDFDRPELIDPWLELVREALPGTEARLSRIKTPKGGAHFYYRAPEIEGNQKLAMEPGVDETGKPANRVLIETRGEGGYVLAPGSPGPCHPTGRTYEYVSGPKLTEIQTLAVEERKALLEAARSFNKVPKQVQKSHDEKPKPAQKGELRPGDDFNARATWEEVLGPHGWTLLRRAGETAYWRRPGKTDVGASATTGHCGDHLYVFSTNAHPFESDTAYTKFSAFTRLEHGGNYEEAARALSQKGYGVRSEKGARKKRAEKEDDDPWWDGSKFRTQILAAQLCVEKQYIATPIGEAKGVNIYVYENGVFHYGGASVAETETRRALGDRAAPKLIDMTLDMIRRNRKIDYAHVNAKAKEFINVKNGMLEWRAGKLHPHDPSYLSTIQINAEYDPDAKSQELDKFFTDIFPPDAIPLVEEFMGYLLIPDTGFEKCFIAVGGGGNGKALALDTPIPTPSGWTTQGALRVGDMVFNEDGIPCRVTGISETWKKRPCYRLRFSDGSEIIADANHEWRAINARHQKVHKVTTEQISKRVIMRERVIGKEVIRERMWGIQVTKPLELPSVDLPIDPYLLGAWLGNGTSVESHLTFGEQDAQHYISEFEKLSYYTKLHQYKPGAVRVTVSPVVESRGRGRDSLKGRLRSLGVLGKKHIPISYLRASQNQRLALLQGLMDTDGSTLKTQAQCEFVSMTKVLAENVFELICSLGLRPTLATGIAKIKDRIIGEKYRVIFTTLPGIDVFRLPRKIAACQPRRSKLQRKIIACDPVPSVSVRCIQVDSLSHLYLCGRAMIPTHNSTYLMLLRHMLGEANVSAISLHKLVDRERFDVAELYGKLANIFNDLGSGLLRSTDIFKLVTTGDPLTAEKKYKDPFTFIPFARMVFSANQFPRSYDKSEAFVDRLIFVPFPNRFRGAANQVHKYHEVLVKTPGVLESMLNRAVQGLQRLSAQRKFTMPKVSEEALEQYRRECNSAYDFLKETCAVVKTGWIGKKTLYDTYFAWSQDSGVKPLSKRHFNETVAEHIPVRETARDGYDGWSGVAWKNGRPPETRQSEVAEFEAQKKLFEDTKAEGNEF